MNLSVIRRKSPNHFEIFLDLLEHSKEFRKDFGRPKRLRTPDRNPLELGRRSVVAPDEGRSHEEGRGHEEGLRLRAFEVLAADGRRVEAERAEEAWGRSQFKLYEDLSKTWSRIWSTTICRPKISPPKVSYQDIFQNSFFHDLSAPLGAC